MTEKRIHRHIRRIGPWGQLASDVQIVIASNVGGEDGPSAEEEARLSASDGAPRGAETAEREEEDHE
jgi:hypothetical protein